MLIILISFFFNAKLRCYNFWGNAFYVNKDALLAFFLDCRHFRDFSVHICIMDTASLLNMSNVVGRNFVNGNCREKVFKILKIVSRKEFCILVGNNDLWEYKCKAQQIVCVYVWWKCWNDLSKIHLILKAMTLPKLRVSNPTPHIGGEG